MNTKIQVTALNADDLCTLFSDSGYGNSAVGFDYDDKFNIFGKECFEDTLANILLNGGEIKVIDYYAEGEKVSEFEDIRCSCTDEETCVYTLNYQELLANLNKVLADERPIGSWSSTPRKDICHSLLTTMLDGEGDMWTAYNLLQFIVFGNEIYG